MKRLLAIWYLYKVKKTYPYKNIGYTKPALAVYISNQENAKTKDIRNLCEYPTTCVEITVATRKDICTAEI